jgi:HEAT repeat protein
MRSMQAIGHRLARLLNVRPGEGSLAIRVALLFAILEAARGFGEIGVDTLVIGRLGTQSFPYLFIALGVASLVAALAYGAALGRLPRVPLFVGLFAAIASLIVGQRLWLASGAPEAVMTLWLTVYAAGGLAVTIYWTVAGSVFDARQAKRLFPLLTGAAIVGSFLGTLAAGPASLVGGTETLVVLEAVLVLVAAALLSRLPTRAPARVRAAARTSMLGDLRAGFDFVARSPLMRLVAVAYVLLAILNFSVSFPLLTAAEETFATESEIATALGLLSTAITATSFVVSMVVANRLYARFGVASGAIALPLVYLVGFGLWIVQFTFATAVIVRFSQQVTQRGVSNAAWSAFYNVVPARRRAQVLAFNDGVPGQIGTILSGILLLAAGRVLTPDQVPWLGAVTALLAVVVALGIRRRYAGSLLLALRSEEAEQVLEGGPGLGSLARDPTVLTCLLTVIRAPEPGVRQMAASMLGRLRVPGSREALLGALGDEDARVRAESLRAISLSKEGLDGVDVDAYADDPSPLVRAAAMVAQADHDIAPDDPLLRDSSPYVRAAALSELADPDGAAGRAVLLAALADEAGTVRDAAASALGASEADAHDLVEVLHHDEPPAQRAALAALAVAVERDPSLHTSVADWLVRRLQRAAELRDARAAIQHGGEPGATQPVAAFLESVLASRQRALEELALAALGALGSPEAGGVIRRCLRSADIEVRAQAMEALDSIADRRIATALIPLLESDGADAGATGGSAALAALRRMTDDADPWIAALARRWLEDEQGGADMAGTERTLGDLETMLLLRRVPLFAGLGPEDLQRIATTCLERTWSAGETIMREGDLEDELVLLVSGSVRVVRMEGDGSERLIRRYQAGDHIGELAVLREAPRSANVVAEEDLRGLVIGGDALKSILRERPDAAMSMLGTLAERISRQ